MVIEPMHIAYGEPKEYPKEIETSTLKHLLRAPDAETLEPGDFNRNYSKKWFRTRCKISPPRNDRAILAESIIIFMRQSEATSFNLTSVEKSILLPSTHVILEMQARARGVGSVHVFLGCLD